MMQATVTTFAVKAIQVDGWSEFHAEFEQACPAQGVRLFILASHSLKLNGHVERAQRTHKQESTTTTTVPWIWGT